MVRYVFDIKNIKYKLFISFIIFLIFLPIYKLLPAGELGLAYENISTLDLLYNTLLIHIGIPILVKPTTTRAKILIIIHLIINYTIYLL